MSGNDENMEPVWEALNKLQSRITGMPPPTVEGHEDLEADIMIEAITRSIQEISEIDRVLKNGENSRLEELQLKIRRSALIGVITSFLCQYSAIRKIKFGEANEKHFEYLSNVTKQYQKMIRDRKGTE